MRLWNPWDGVGQVSPSAYGPHVRGKDAGWKWGAANERKAEHAGWR